MSTALVLTGGGARVAYQVGVLKGIASVIPRSLYNPFPIVTGTSAGAINAISIAGRPGPFRLRIRKLETIWSNINASDIYRTDFLGVTKNAFHVLVSLLNRRYDIGRPISLLDNSPLRQLLCNYVKFNHLETAIESGELEAIAMTGINYNTSQSITFYQGHKGLKNWKRARREGRLADINIDHLMASSAIPGLFPAVSIDGDYYGDGALRQLNPISPALHMGATKLLTISVSDSKPKLHLSMPQQAPSIGGILGHMLNSAFTDAIANNLETLKTINKLVDAVPEKQQIQQGLSGLKSIDVLSIMPSQSIDQIAAEYLDKLPLSIKLFFRISGANQDNGSTSAASYLLFQPDFCTRLIQLGFEDAIKQTEKLKAFFNL